MGNDVRADYARAAASRGDFEMAKAAVIDLVAEDWNNAEAHRAWGEVLLREGKSADAVAAYRTAVSIEPRRAELHFELAKALLDEAERNPFLKLSNWGETREAVEAGLQMWPNHEEGLHLRQVVEDMRTQVLS